MAEIGVPIRTVFTNNTTCSARIEAQYNEHFAIRLQPNSEIEWFIVSLAYHIYQNYEQQKAAKKM